MGSAIVSTVSGRSDSKVSGRSDSKVIKAVDQHNSIAHLGFHEPFARAAGC
jgi:hypothetical protein